MAWDLSTALGLPVGPDALMGPRQEGARPEKLPASRLAVGARPEKLSAHLLATGAHPEKLPAPWLEEGARPENLPAHLLATGARPENMPAPWLEEGSRPEKLPAHLLAAGARPENLPAPWLEEGARPEKLPASRLAEGGQAGMAGGTFVLSPSLLLELWLQSVRLLDRPWSDLSWPLRQRLGLLSAPPPYLPWGQYLVMMQLSVEAGAGRLPTKGPELAARAQGLPAKVQDWRRELGGCRERGCRQRGRG